MMLADFWQVTKGESLHPLLISLAGELRFPALVTPD
jgi:hypothetical protein